MEHKVLGNIKYWDVQWEEEHKVLRCTVIMESEGGSDKTHMVREHNTAECKNNNRVFYWVTTCCTLVCPF